jgi:hypothetical protein
MTWSDRTAPPPWPRAAFSVSVGFGRMTQVTPDQLLTRRLAGQHLTSQPFPEPAAAVASLGAVQAQEYAQSLWAVGLRTSQPSAAAVEAAIERGEVLRTWPMRGTIHLVPAADAGWMVDLLAGRRVRQAAGVYGKIGLTEGIFARAASVVTDALSGGRRLRRAELYALLTGQGIDCSSSPHGSRGGHILGYLSMTGLTCLGPLDGRQSTVVLLSDWAPRPRRPEDPAAELATRYFTSHGPATVRDFGWWSGLTLGEIRPAVERAGIALAVTEMDGQQYWHAAAPPGPDHDAAVRAAETGPAGDGALLLPAFDEYTVAYRDRSAPAGGRELPAGELLNPVMLLDGRAVGLWRARAGARTVRIELGPFGRLPAADRARMHQAADRYAAFVGLQAEIIPAAAADLSRQRNRPPSARPAG